MIRTLDVLIRVQKVYDSCENFVHITYAKKYTMMMVHKFVRDAEKRFGIRHCLNIYLNNEVITLKEHCKFLRKRREMEMYDERK